MITAAGSCGLLKAEVDEQRKLVMAHIPWDAITKMAAEEAGAWINELLACRRQWEAKCYTFRTGKAEEPPAGLSAGGDGRYPTARTQRT